MSITIVYKDFEEMKALARQLLKDELNQMPAAEAAAMSILEPVRETEPLPFSEPAPEPEPAKAPAGYSQAEVRKFLGDLRKAGKKEAVSSLIMSLGYAKFTDIPDDKLPELMEKAREI